MAGDPRVPRAAVLRAGLTPSAAVVLVAGVVTAFVLADAFEGAHRILGWVVACSVVALLIDPVVSFVSRLLPRWLSVVLVLIAILSVIAVLVTGLATDLLESVDDLKDSAERLRTSAWDRFVSIFAESQLKAQLETAQGLDWISRSLKAISEVDIKQSVIDLFGFLTGRSGGPAVPPKAPPRDRKGRSPLRDRA